MGGQNLFTRRELLRLSAAGAGMLALAGSGPLSEILTGYRLPQHRHAFAGGVNPEAIDELAVPTSPLILSPFSDPLPIPRALAPVPSSLFRNWSSQPGPGAGKQCSYVEKHQVWTSQLGLPDPIVYQIKMQVAGHSFSSSQVQAIDSLGNPTVSWDAQRNPYPAGTLRNLPASTIYGFNGTFPGPRINAEYGRPCLVRIENHLDENPLNLDRGDFGADGPGFLTHLHNGHTAPESDGQPHQMMRKHGKHGYEPGTFVDNLYLNYPAGGDEREKQSFFWFHCHYMDYTGANVYKGMVGLYPIYDRTNGLDMGDERQGLHLPGIRTDHPDGSFDVDYDIPLALYDCRLDDGTTPHLDLHNGVGETHPEWWGKTFFRHYPKGGFVGDVFTVNGTAYPVLEVKRRKYRLRFLDASISRIYELQFMTSSGGPKTARSLTDAFGIPLTGDELQGQYRIPDGQQCMRFTQIATDGGLIPHPIVRDSFELWPAKRREFIVDFTRYMDGSPTRPGDVIYLTNILKMTDGLKPAAADPAYKVPMMKIVIGDDAPDDSLIPTSTTVMRELPPLPSPTELATLVANKKVFTLTKGGPDAESRWVINGLPFDPDRVDAFVPIGTGEVWEIKNGGGGWVHPLHLHMEEHRVISRDGVPAPDARHPDDLSREDVVALDQSESVLIYRKFRTFTGPYVTHCHNLAHEDHAMMFGWEITGDNQSALPAPEEFPRPVAQEPAGPFRIFFPSVDKG